MGPAPVRIAGPTFVAQTVHCADFGRNRTQIRSGLVFLGKLIALPRKLFFWRAGAWIVDFMYEMGSYKS